jgi:hypothetical protein
MEQRTRLVMLNKGLDILKKATLFFDGDDYKILSDLIEKYDTEVKNYNYEKITVLNKTKSELANTHAGFKKTLSHYYLNDLLKEINNFISQSYIENPICIEHQKIDSCGLGDDLCIDCDIEYGRFTKYQSEKKEDFDKLHSDLHKAIDATNFDEDLIDSKILFHRTVNYYKMTPLEKEVNESMRIEGINDFNKKNKTFIDNLLIKKIEILKKLNDT